MSPSGTDPSASTERYEVLAVRFASRRTRASEVYLNHHLYDEPDHELVLDYFLWVVRGHGRTLLVDTGFTPEVGEQRGRTLSCTVPEALHRVGVDPAEVDDVVVTHAHWDHTGNIGLFPRARVTIAGAELDFWNGSYAGRHQIGHACTPGDVEQINALERAGRVDRTVGRHRLYPGVELIEVGGHTPGQLLVLVAGERNPVLLASDAVHFMDEVELDRPFAVLTDVPAMYAAYDTVTELCRRSPETRVVPGHDPAVLTQFESIDPADPGLGVRVG